MSNETSYGSRRFLQAAGAALATGFVAGCCDKGVSPETGRPARSATLWMSSDRLNLFDAATGIALAT